VHLLLVLPQCHREHLSAIRATEEEAATVTGLHHERGDDVVYYRTVALLEALGAYGILGYPREHGTAFPARGMNTAIMAYFSDVCRVSPGQSVFSKERINEHAKPTANCRGYSPQRAPIRAGPSTAVLSRDDILRYRDESSTRAITILRSGGIIGPFAMTRAKAKRSPEKQGVRTMSAQESAWLAWYMCAVSLLLTSCGVLFLVASQSREGTPVFDYGLLNTVIAVSFSPVGAVIAPRLPPRNPIGWLFCAIGFFGAVRLFVAEYAIATLLAPPDSWLGALPGGEGLAWVSSWVWVVHFGPFIFLALLFPDGKLPSRRWRPFAWLVALAVAGGAVAVAVWPATAARFDSVTSPLGIEVAANVINPVETIMYALALTASASLLVRLIRSRGIERQQVKWFAFAVAMLATSTTLAYVVSEALDMRLLGWISSVLVILSMVSLPVAMSIAILRYRLYQIDSLINRTLVYGSLTVVLALVYFVAIVVLHRVLILLTGQESTLTVVASTLLIAALFSPLRRTIQSLIDRRFYRRKYDARKTLEAFSSHLRNETDLYALSDDLVEVVRETMQPEHVSLWLRSPQDRTSPRKLRESEG
jgi:hypothetical protein